MKNSNLIHIGTFTNPIGLKGEIKIKFLTSSVESFKSLTPYLDNYGENIWNFEYLKVKNEQLIGKLKDYNNRNKAENLKYKQIYTTKDNLPKIKKNEYYVSDLINCTVVNSKKIPIGLVLDLKNYGAGDLLYIKGKNNNTFYIPMNNENIINVDIKKKIITVDPIKGILN